MEVTKACRGAVVASVFVSLLAVLPVSARAQSGDWEVVFAPYVLFGTLTGDAAIGSSGAVPIHLGFDDLLENLELGAMMHAEIWKGRWGVVGDLVFMRLGSDITLPGTRVLDIEVNEVVIEGLVGRRFHSPGRQVDLFAGVRYWALDLDLVLSDGPGTGSDLGDSWVDPVVGARVLQDVGEDWFLTARGDVGGFGVGSDFSWNVQGGVGYEVSTWFSLVAQYRALGVDFANDEAGIDYLLYDTITHGPLLGFVFRF